MTHITKSTFANITANGIGGKKVISTKVTAQKKSILFRVNAEHATRSVGYATMHEYRMHEFAVPKSEIYLVSAAVEEAEQRAAAHVTISVKEQGIFTIPKSAFPDIKKACNPQNHFSWTAEKDDMTSFLKQYVKDCAARREETDPIAHQNKVMGRPARMSAQQPMPA